MTAGLPGIGIGGLFYFLVALAMPFRELARAFRKQTSVARWKFIALQVSFVVLVVSGMYAEGLLFNMFTLWVQDTLLFKFLAGHSIVAPLTFQKTQMFGITSGGAGLLSLGCVYLAMHVVRMIVHRKPAAKAEISAAA